MRNLRRAMTAGILAALLATGTAAGAGATRFPARPAQSDITPALRSWYVASSPGIPAAAPGCGKGVLVRKVVAKYKAKKYQGGGYRTDILYCGNAKYGYRHLLGHIKHYFGGWSNFSFSIAQTLKKPAGFVAQKNGNFLESAPILQCFYAGYYIIWTFFVVPRIKTGDIVTAYGREGKRVNQSCP